MGEDRPPIDYNPADYAIQPIAENNLTRLDQEKSMLKKSLTVLGLVFGAMLSVSARAERAENADEGGVYTNTYYLMSAKLTIRKGRFFNEAAGTPYAVNPANLIVVTNCILRIDGYDAATQAYGHTLICNGLNGWEIADFTEKGGSFFSVNDGFGSIGHDWADLYMGASNASFWTGTNWWGEDYFLVEYNGRELFTAKMDKTGKLKSVKADGFKDGMLWLNDERGDDSWFTSSTPRLKVKYVPVAKLDPNAIACFTNWDSDAPDVNPPCDPN